MPNTEYKLIIESKFRRETSNFKANFDASDVDRSSNDPVLIKYIEKNLKPEELLGVVVTTETSDASVSSTVSAVQKFVEEGCPMYEMTCVDIPIPPIYYIPSTGALSLIGPYAESEEGGETGEAIFVNPGVPEGNSAL